MFVHCLSVFNTTNLIKSMNSHLFAVLVTNTRPNTGVCYADDELSFNCCWEIIC